MSPVAVEAQDIPALLCALVAIAVVIILVDQLFWRPLVAWGDRFKLGAVPRRRRRTPGYWISSAVRLPSLLAGICPGA